jgi:hypothetical protein
LRSQDPLCPWGASCCSSAAMRGDLSTLQWLRSQDPPCPWDARSPRQTSDSLYVAARRQRAAGCSHWVGAVRLIVRRDHWSFRQCTPWRPAVAGAVIAMDPPREQAYSRGFIQSPPTFIYTDEEVNAVYEVCGVVYVRVFADRCRNVYVYVFICLCM